MAKPSGLLERAQWRDAVLTRDRTTCVVCGGVATEVHHILERGLFSDGGYYTANGVSVCGACHLRCERSEVSCEELRGMAGINVVVLASGLESGVVYDKWGNSLVDGTWYPGPMFYEEGVQKVLAATGRLSSFSSRVKMSRTPHLPWSEGVTSDDILLADAGGFVGEIVVSTKMDGECTTIGRDQNGVYCHARSLDSVAHVSQSWVRALSGRVGELLPLGWRVVGENVQAVHSIAYKNLPGYFLAFGVVNDQNEFLSWDETVTWCELLEIPIVAVLYSGAFSESTVRACWTGADEYGEQEGYVVRPRESFHYKEYATRVAKFVRKGHVTSDTHWKSQAIIENELAV